MSFVNLKRVKQVVGGQTTYSVYSSLTGRVAVLDNATSGERFNLLSLGPVQVRVPATGAAGLGGRGGKARSLL